MAHEISQVMIDGRQVSEAMFANKPAWHKLGATFDQGGNRAPDSATAMALAHLDWSVEKEEIQLKRDGRDVPGFYSLVRQDTRDPLSVVGPEYQVLQNRDAFAFLDGLLPDGILTYESAFALKGGRGVVLLARMPTVDYVTPEDPQLRHVLLSTWFGGGAIRAKPCNTRVVCWNTLQAAFGEHTCEFRIPHSGDVASKMATARQGLAQFDKQFSGYIDGARRLLVGCTPQQAREYLAELFAAPADDAPIKTRNNFERKMAEVSRARASEANNLATIRGTWWALVNSVTEYVDHGKAARQSRDERARAENRFLSVTHGDGATLKARAFDLALTMSA